MDDLVTFQEAYVHLRIEDEGTNGSPHDPWLAIFIPAISEAVRMWLKQDWRLYVPMVDTNGPVLDSNGDPVPALPLEPRWAVKAAVLVELASQFRYREGEGRDNVVPSDAGYGYTLNKASTALLGPLRRSTLA